MRPAALSLLLTGAALLAAGCDGEAPETEAGSSGAETVRTAARATLDEPVTGIRLRTASAGGGSFDAEGLIELAGGRFRVAVDADPVEAGFGAPAEVVGTEGEGFEETVAVQERGFGKLDGPCWFNPHAPVGSFLGTVSVEEAVRLGGSVVESLGGGEIKAAEATGGGRYSVRLTPSAGRPRNDFKDSDERTWGDRALIAELGAPIAVTIAGGRLSGLRLRLARYEPYAAAPDPEPIRGTSIELELRPTDDALRIEQPECFGIE